MTKTEADGADVVVSMPQAMQLTRTKNPTYSVFMHVPVERVERLAQDLGRNSVLVLVEHEVGQKSREGAIDQVCEGLREDERYGSFVVALTGALQEIEREDPDAELRASIIAEFRQALPDAGDDELYAMADRAIKASRHDA